MLDTERPLVIDHRDNNNRNNDLSNLQILCRSCNYLKNPRRPVDLCVSEEETHDQTELEVNRQREPLFRRYVLHLINEQISIPQKDLIDSGSEHVSISPVTAKRYLDKMCSSTGICQRHQVGKIIVIEYKKVLPLI